MKTNAERENDNYVVIGLNLLLLFLLLIIIYQTLGVFIGVFTYAIIFSVALYGVFEKLVNILGNRRKIAGFIYGLVLVAVIAVPSIYMISMLTSSFQNLREFFNSIKEHHVPPLPQALTKIPVIGDKATEIWADVESDPQKVIEMYGTQIRTFFQHMISAGGGIIGAALELIIGIIISAVVLTMDGKKLILPVEAVLIRLTGFKQGASMIDASGKAIRGVAFGVMGTGFIAAGLAWICFTIAGLSTAALLAAITFLLVVVQIGPALVVIAVVAYLVNTGQTGSAIFVGIYGVVVLMGVDNILKPILIARSGKMPVLVLFLGVVGGMAAWGFTGMFKGAIVLSLMYTLYNSWITVNREEIEAFREKAQAEGLTPTNQAT